MAQSDVGPSRARQLRFVEGERYALAFSGGCDSACLLAEMLAAGVDVRAYYAKTAFQAGFELDDARLVAASLGVDFEVVEIDVLAHDEVCANEPDRCYRCKRLLFETLLARMAEDGRTLLVDGTNASDDPARRPGMRALDELGVVSPLREAGWTKDDVRARSRERGLITADKPNFSCYATKVPHGTRLTAVSLREAARKDAPSIAAWVAARDGAIDSGEGAR